ncbi:hypothetical protein GCM10010924_05720 [Rhizobium wenxiniae]|nr:hypothetical protein GCM10010924_05720 [Rhizobium wenxiniae]
MVGIVAANAIDPAHRKLFGYADDIEKHGFGGRDHCGAHLGYPYITGKTQGLCPSIRPAILEMKENKFICGQMDTAEMTVSG